MLEQSLFAFVQDASACAIAQPLVKKLIGRNPIALSASNWEASPEVGICMKAHQAVVTAQALVILAMTRAWHRASTVVPTFLCHRLSACMGNACSSYFLQDSEVRSLPQTTVPSDCTVWTDSTDALWIAASGHEQLYHECNFEVFFKRVADANAIVSFCSVQQA